MPYVIRFVCRMDGEPTGYDGEYLKSYDASYVPSNGKYNGGDLITTPNIEEAQKFETPSEALTTWKETAPKPWSVRLWDGKPNRPLTAYTIEVIGFSKDYQTVWNFNKDINI